MAGDDDYHGPNSGSMPPPGFREPPYNVEAEQALLGAILVNNEAWHRVRSFLKPDHFYEPVHGRIFAACERLITAGHVADPITLGRAFRDDEALRELDGAEYLRRMALSAEAILNAEDYGRLIHDLAVRRALIRLSEDICNRAYDPRSEVTGTDLLGEAEGQLRDLTSEVPRSLRSIDWPSLQGEQAPERSYIVEDWLPRGCVTSLYGEGGTGKSFLAQILGTCIATGTKFMGLDVVRGPVLGIFCEDTTDELWWRQLRINRALGVDMHELQNWQPVSRVGEVSTLLHFDSANVARPTPFYMQIREEAKRRGAKLVILDNIAQMYSGSEIDRHQSTVFLNLVAGIALEIQGAVLLAGHPPASPGAEKPYSGSTAWIANVRSMWAFSRLSEDKSPPGVEAFELKRVKSNFSGKATRTLILDPATRVVRPDDPKLESDQARAMREQRVLDVRERLLQTLDAIMARGHSASDHPKAQNYLPKLAESFNMHGDARRHEMAAALEGLIKDGEIVPNAVIGQYKNRAPKTGLARAR